MTRQGQAVRPPLGSVELGGRFCPEQLNEFRDETLEHVHLVAHELRNEVRAAFIVRMGELVRDAVIDPATVERLGYEAGAIALRARLPKPGNVRIGDFGEIIASEFVRIVLGATVSYRLRRKENVNVAMHGVDCIGVRLVDGRAIFYKGESKVRDYLKGDALEEARYAVEADNGHLRAEDLVLVIDEQRRAGNAELEHAVASELVLRSEHITRHIIFAAFATSTANCIGDLIAALNSENRTYLTTLKIDTLAQFIDDVYALLGVRR